MSSSKSRCLWWCCFMLLLRCIYLGMEVAPKLQIARKLERGVPVTIACFGDSVTGVYYHTGSRRAWCDLVGIALKKIYPNAQLEMINAGVSGNDTAAGLKRMEADVLSRNPELVVVMFGLNDLVRLPVEAYRANLMQIINRSRERQAEVILMTPNSIYSDDPRRLPSRVADYAEVVRQVGEQLQTTVADPRPNEGEGEGGKPIVGYPHVCRRCSSRAEFRELIQPRGIPPHPQPHPQPLPQRSVPESARSPSAPPGPPTPLPRFSLVGARGVEFTRVRRENTALVSS